MADINPSSIASQLATAFTQGMQTRLDTQSKSAMAVSTALGKLRSALQTFDSALTGLSGKKTLAQFSTTFSATGFGSATASAGAMPGTYSLFVEKIATAHQVAFQNVPTTPAAGAGKLTVNLNGGVVANPTSGLSFEIDFATANTDGDTTLSPTEIARAINLAAGNAGKVSAMVITAGTDNQLVLTAADTGAASQITLDTANITDASLAAAFGAGVTKVTAQDAVVYVGGDAATGLKQVQASNTFTNIPGVSMSFTQAQAAGSAPLSLTVAADNSGTAANVKTFVDAYNALTKALDPLTDAGNPGSGKAAGTFASDAGVRALRSRLNDLVHQQFGGVGMFDLGLSIDRDGVMSLKDEAKLQKTLAARPDALDNFFGKTSLTASSGVLGSLDKYLQGWLSSVNGQIKHRQDSVQSLQKTLTSRQDRLDKQYSMAYDRYLKQFTKLQELQSQMGQTSDMFASMAANQTT